VSSNSIPYCTKVGYLSSLCQPQREQKPTSHAFSKRPRPQARSIYCRSSLEFPLDFRSTYIIFIRPHKYTNGPTSQKVKSVLVGDGFVEKTNFTRTQRTYTLLLLEPPTSQKKVRLEFFFAFIRHSVFAPHPVWLLTVERTL
jgi:hypothetical protein